MTTILTIERLFNVALACVAFSINLDKMVSQRLWRIIEVDAMLRWLSLFGLLSAFILSSFLAILADVPVGLWTVIWTPAMAWAVISGFLSRGKDST